MGVCVVGLERDSLIEAGESFIEASEIVQKQAVIVENIVPGRTGGDCLVVGLQRLGQASELVKSSGAVDERFYAVGLEENRLVQADKCFVQAPKPDECKTPIVEHLSIIGF